MTGFANKCFSTQDFPINFIEQRYITLETPVKQNGTEIHCFLLVVRKMVQTKIFCPLLPPLETCTQIPLIFLGFFNVIFNTLSLIF